MILNKKQIREKTLKEEQDKANYNKIIIAITVKYSPERTKWIKNVTK